MKPNRHQDNSKLIVLYVQWRSEGGAVGWGPHKAATC